MVQQACRLGTFTCRKKKKFTEHGAAFDFKHAHKETQRHTGARTHTADVSPQTKTSAAAHHILRRAPHLSVHLNLICFSWPFMRRCACARKKKKRGWGAEGGGKKNITKKKIKSTAIGFVLCLYKMIDPMKNLINPQDENSCVTHMSKSISYPLPVNRKLTFWTKWRDPWGACDWSSFGCKTSNKHCVKSPKKSVSIFFFFFSPSLVITYANIFCLCRLVCCMSRLFLFLRITFFLT